VAHSAGPWGICYRSVQNQTHISPKIAIFVTNSPCFPLCGKSHSWPTARLHDFKTVCTVRLVQKYKFFFNSGYIFSVQKYKKTKISSRFLQKHINSFLEVRFQFRKHFRDAWVIMFSRLRDKPRLFYWEPLRKAMRGLNRSVVRKRLPTPWCKPGVPSRSRNGSEVFVWSRIPKNNRSRSRIFSSDSES